MSEERQIGLCEQCAHHSLVTSSHGSEFHLCGKSKTDESFPKYPKLPVLHCHGYIIMNSTANNR